MCGIAGIVQWDADLPLRDIVGSMCDALQHRGPDDVGVWASERVSLGMRRLSIIDLDTGQQPISNEDGTVWVVLNGEIYNFRELRAELQARGHRFKTSGDTETIVHLYEEIGAQAVTRLRGMFAIAIWDATSRELLLARDRLGIKPLYYARVDGAFAFASELKALLPVPGLERRLNWAAVPHVFTSLSTPAEHSILEGVDKLAPGHVARLGSDHKLRTERYWDLTFAPDDSMRESDVIDQLRAHLDDAVQSHMVSDVPVGAFLSGGIDSSAVLATMRRFTDKPIHTFSIGFAERGHDESEAARAVATHLGTTHHALRLEAQPVELCESLVWYLDEPFGDSSAIPTFAVSRLAAEHVKVVLTGDGGDEIFGGYEKYVVEQREQRRDAWPKPIRRALGAIGDAMAEGMKGRNFLRHLALDGPQRYLDASSLFRYADHAQLLHPEAIGAIAATGAPEPWAGALEDMRSVPAGLSALQYCDLHHYLPLDILTKVDRMTMANSLEARPPLIDHHLVEFAATIPSHLLIRDGVTKYALKAAVRRQIPDAIIDRPKHGFAVPLARWLRHEWNAFMRDTLLSTRARQRGVFNPAYVEKLIDLHEHGRDLDAQLWTVLSFELWCRMFLDPPDRAVTSRTRADADGVACA
jgi:asparagine synthase (glutamine-hydrolysing)